VGVLSVDPQGDGLDGDVTHICAMTRMLLIVETPLGGVVLSLAVGGLPAEPPRILKHKHVISTATGAFLGRQLHMHERLALLETPDDCVDDSGLVLWKSTQQKPLQGRVTCRCLRENERTAERQHVTSLLSYHKEREKQWF
jgi:hypothetical protein